MRVRTITASRALSAVVGSVLAIGLLVPGASKADTLYAKVIAYEVAEHIKFRGAAGGCDDFKKRFAGATLIGDGVDGGPPFTAPRDGKGNPIWGRKFIDANATSLIRSDKGCRGPIAGTFHVLEDFDPASELLSTLQVVAQGRLRGTLDLSTIETTGTAPVSGTWRVHGSHLKGKVQGAFAAPFFVGLGPTGFAYMDVDPTANSCRQNDAPEGGAEVLLPIGPSGSMVPVCFVHPEEFLLGFPLTKVVLFLTVD